MLNATGAEGVITDYAMFGAIAQMKYTEPVATLDAEVLVAVPSPQKLDLLKPIYKFCAARGSRVDRRVKWCYGDVLNQADSYQTVPTTGGQHEQPLPA